MTGSDRPGLARCGSAEGGRLRCSLGRRGRYEMIDRGCSWSHGERCRGQNQSHDANSKGKGCRQVLEADRWSRSGRSHEPVNDHRPERELAVEAVGPGRVVIMALASSGAARPPGRDDRVVANIAGGGLGIERELVPVGVVEADQATTRCSRAVLVPRGRRRDQPRPETRPAGRPHLRPPPAQRSPLRGRQGRRRH